MSTFLLFFCSFLVTFGSRTYRSDETQKIQSGEGGWGSFSSWIYCEPGQYGKGYKLGITRSDTGWTHDNFGATGFRLLCDDNEELNAGNDLYDNQFGNGLLGDYTTKNCNSQKLIKGFQSKVQGHVCSGLGSCDDAALTSIRTYCTDGQELVINNAGWGSWSSGGAKICPDGSAVCGFRQKVEGFQFFGSVTFYDNTGLNAVQLACCKTPKEYSNADGYWISVYRGNGGLEGEYSITVGMENYAESSFSTENTQTLETSVSASMSFSYGGVGGEVSTSLTSGASNTVFRGSVESYLTTVTQQLTVSCNSGVALYQFVTSIRESGINQDSHTFEVRGSDYICSQSGDAPKCPYDFCSDLFGDDPDCQICKDGTFQ